MKSYTYLIQNITAYFTLVLFCAVGVYNIVRANFVKINYSKFFEKKLGFLNYNVSALYFLNRFKGNIYAAQI